MAKPTSIPVGEMQSCVAGQEAKQDAALSQDGQVLLSHDPYRNADFVHRPDGRPLTPAEGKALRLYSLPYAEIRRYDVGGHGNPKFVWQQSVATYKPLLGEVINSAEAYARRLHRLPSFYNIETKTTPAGDGL
jgi:glycerophosphoryl diester phosphodiesterase